MGLLHDFVEQLMLEFEKEHSDMSEDEMLSFFIDSLTKSIPEVSDVIFKSILKTIPDILPHIQSDISEFVERNIYYWQKGLNLLEVLNSVNLEIGESTWKEWDIENTNEEHKREVLRRLHVKSCQVAAVVSICGMFCVTQVISHLSRHSSLYKAFLELLHDSLFAKQIFGSLVIL